MNNDDEYDEQSEEELIKKVFFKKKPRKLHRITVPKDFDEIRSVAVYDAIFPRAYWQQDFLFGNFPDVEWQKLTELAFPKTLSEEKKSHPIFVVQADSFSQKVCPCSTRPGNHGPNSITVPEGTTLEITEHKTDKESYILSRKLSYPLAPESEFDAEPRFWGKVPSSILDKNK